MSAWRLKQKGDFHMASDVENIIVLRLPAEEFNRIITVTDRCGNVQGYSFLDSAGKSWNAAVAFVTARADGDIKKIKEAFAVD